MHWLNAGTPDHEIIRIKTRAIDAIISATGAGASLALGIECFAGGEHYRNFRTYMQRGSIKELAAESGLRITTTEVRGNGIFVVAQALPALNDS